MKFNKLSFLAAAVAAGTSVKALSVITPSPEWWWQTGDSALLSWDCSDRAHDQFAVVAINNNTQLLPAGTSILIGIQENSQCSTTLTPNLNVGTGYRLTFTNIVNYTDVFATSEAFEIKPKGSPYPSIPTPEIPNGAGGSGTARPSATSNSTQPNAGFAQASFTLGGAVALIGSVAALIGA